MEICFNCGAEVDEEADYCCGCGEYVCQECDGALPLDTHSPQIHVNLDRETAAGRARRREGD